MQHSPELREKWKLFSLYEQMANIGSEIFRAIQWKTKNNPDYAQQANIRALELIDLTLSLQYRYPYIKELTRMRELWLDFFMGNNQYKQSQNQWEKYFYAFTYAARSEKV